MHEIYIDLLAENPSLYLNELCQIIRATIGITVLRSTLCSLLMSNGMSRREISHVAKQRCIQHGGAYTKHILQYPVNWLIFLDKLVVIIKIIVVGMATFL